MTNYLWASVIIIVFLLVLYPLQFLQWFQELDQRFIESIESLENNVVLLLNALFFFGITMLFAWGIWVLNR
jgi:hypothetical protein